MTYRSTKTYGHELGLSACFRQWRATDSHCHFLHGYALSFKFTFECDDLDSRNWCVDFGGLKGLKEQLVHMFDHKLLVAIDDPQLESLCALGDIGAADVYIIGRVGCEAFAELAYRMANRTLERDAPRVRCIEVECAEHGANSAIYIP